MIATSIYSQRFIGDYTNSTPTDNDKLLGTDASTGSVKNFLISALSSKVQTDYVNSATGIKLIVEEYNLQFGQTIDDILPLMTPVTIAYDEILILDLIDISFGNNTHYIYMCKVGAGTFGNGATVLESTDFIQLNQGVSSGGGSDLQVTLSKDYIFSGDVNGDPFPDKTIGVSGESLESMLTNFVNGESFINGGFVNLNFDQSIEGVKSFLNGIKASGLGPKKKAIDILLDNIVFDQGNGVPTNPPSAAVMWESTIGGNDIWISGYEGRVFANDRMVYDRGSLTFDDDFTVTTSVDVGNDFAQNDDIKLNPTNVEYEAWQTNGTMSFRKTASDVVQIVLSLATPDGATFALPAGYRPSSNTAFTAVNTGNGVAFVTILTDGTVSVSTSAPAETLFQTVLSFTL